MRKCKVCGTRYEPTRGIQPTCGTYDCMVAYAEKAAKRAADKRSASERKKIADDRRKTRQRLDTLKTIPQLIAEADTAFMAYIRARDRAAGHPCISSGRTLDWNGNAVDAGHFRSRGAASHLRYDEANCHAQSKHDNRWLGGNIVEYRIRLLERIGQSELDRIENDNQAHKWTREELVEIAAKYKRKKKEVERSCKS